MSKSTPTAVRVARWSALAAGVAAFGSFLNTMWTSEPWWYSRIVEKRESAHPTVNAMMSSSDSFVDGITPTMAMSAPDPTLYEKFLLYAQHNQLAVSLIVACGLVIVGSTVIEYFHSKKHKKFQATLSER